MGNFLKRNINTIFVMLGNGCNMNCAYCLQHPLVHEPLAKKINPDIYKFIAEVAEENKDKKVHLQFYGGEPLVYFPNIKEIVAETKKRRIPCSYSVITNGRAMTDEMVKFFNSNEMPVTISWDGYNTMKTRLFDVFQDPVLKERILHIKLLGLSGVISSQAYPKELLEAFQDISDEYYEIHGYSVRVNLDPIFDTGLANKWLLDIDYDRASREMRDMAVNYLEGFMHKKDQREYTKLVYLDGLFQQLRYFYLQENGDWKQYTASCGNGLSVLNLDLDGNLYPCHNTSEKAGAINSGYFQYLQRILAGDKTHLRREHCKSCLALAFCKGGCKLVGDQARNESYCKLKQALFVPVLSVFQEYGTKLVGEKKDDA